MLGSCPVLRGMVPSSRAESDRQLVCNNISGAYATFSNCESQALCHSVSGWHAASVADMETALSNPLDIAGTAQLELGGGPGQPFPPHFSVAVSSGISAQIHVVFKLGVQAYKSLTLSRWLHGSWQAEGELHLSSLRCI